MVKTQLRLKIYLLKTNLNTIPETNLSLFERAVLAHYCQQAILHRGPAYWNCIPFDLKNNKQSV